MTETNVEILNRGIRCLVESLGVIETERFISLMSREKFDYTAWQENFFNGIPDEQLKSEISCWTKEHPYQGKAKVTI